jgi:hypothetical protein
MELSRAVNGDAFAKVVQLHRQLEKEQGCHAEVVGEWFSFADIIGKSAVLRAVRPLPAVEQATSNNLMPSTKKSSGYSAMTVTRPQTNRIEVTHEYSNPPYIRGR